MPGPGSVFTLIDKTSGGAISGTFSNLSDNGTALLGGVSFHSSYSGGDGNNLTLSLVAPTNVYVGEAAVSDFTVTNDVAPAGLSTSDAVTWNPGGTQHPARAQAG